MNDDLSAELSLLWREAKDHVKHWNFNKAIEIYKYILVRYGDSDSAAEQAHACLADVLLTVGRTDEGEKHIRKALSYDPENHRYHYLLGFIYDQRYQWENAVQEYRLALDREPWNHAYLRALGEATFNAGDKETGLQHLLEVAPLYPNNSGMLTQLAGAYMSLGDMDSARKYAEEAVRINPTDIMAHAVLRRIKQEIGEPPY